MLHLYTDGSELVHAACGGWGYVLIGPGVQHSANGFQWRHGSNQMELIAVLEGLDSIACASEVVVHTDSNYVIASARNVHNIKPLVRELHFLTMIHSVQFVKIASGSDEQHNQAHRLAREAMFDAVQMHKSRIPQTRRWTGGPLRVC